MGLFSLAKRKIRSSVGGYVQHQREERAFRQNVNRQAQQVRRKATEQEVLKQEALQAKRRVAQKYNPQPTAYERGLQTTVRTRTVSRTPVKRRKTKKRKSTPKVKTRIVYRDRKPRPQQQPQQDRRAGSFGDFNPFR